MQCFKSVACSQYSKINIPFIVFCIMDFMIVYRIAQIVCSSNAGVMFSLQENNSWSSRVDNNFGRNTRHTYPDSCNPDLQIQAAGSVLYDARKAGAPCV